MTVGTLTKTLDHLCLCLFPVLTLMSCCDLCWSALTLSWDLCCGQNDPERTGKLYWISQRQCPVKRGSHINPSSCNVHRVSQSVSQWSLLNPLIDYATVWSHAGPIRYVPVSPATLHLLLCIYCQHDLFVQTLNKTKQKSNRPTSNMKSEAFD